MRRPIGRLTVARLMLAVGVLALLLAGGSWLTGRSARRGEYGQWAAYYGGRESGLRHAAATIRACPDAAGDAAPCGRCGAAWEGLKAEHATSHVHAARSLEGAADVMGRLAARYRRAAAALWPRLAPAPPADRAAEWELIRGDGVMLWKYFEVL